MNHPTMILRRIAGELDQEAAKQDGAMRASLEAHAQAYREQADAKPYPFANVLPQFPSRAIEWTARLMLAAAVITFLCLLAEVVLQ